MVKIFLSYILFVVTLWANSSYLVLDDAHNSYDSFEMSYYKDATKVMTVEEIALKHESFTPISNKFSLGYNKETLWLKIEIKNSSQEEKFILTTNEHFYEQANLYSYENEWKKAANGVFMPLNQRAVQTPQLSFNLNLAPNESKTVFLELNGVYPYLGNIAVYTKGSFFAHQLISIQSFFILVFGILFIIIIFNLFLWINLKEIIYCYYVGYTFFALIYLINISGLLAYFNLQHHMYQLHFTVSLSIIFLSFFSIEYFNVKQHSKYAVYLLKTLSLLLFIFSCLLMYAYTPWNKFINNTVFLCILSLTTIATMMYLKGHHYLKYYIIAILLYFISIIIYILLLSGAIEYTFFNRYGFLFFLVFEITVFSLMLANRYNIIKNDQIITQKQLIDLKINQNKILKQEVKKQTQNLLKVNQKLSTLIQERELLVKEVFHRVKNNFHMIIAFLWFESKKESNQNRFSELINRIKAMSLIHEYLCNSKDLVDINVQEYLDELIKTVVQTYHNTNIIMNTHVDDVRIGFDNIMSLGVIINEIISNSIKHHPKTSPIVLDIACFSKNHLVVLHIKDNGKGFDENEHPAGFGLNLIKDFSKKLPQGSFCFYQDGGTVFELTFKDIKNDEN